MTTQTYDQQALDAEILKLGQALRERMAGEVPGIFSKQFWQAQIMEWMMRDASFKTDMFRFVDVLPVLETSRQVAEHVREYLLREGRELPGILGMALRAAAGGFTSFPATWMIRKNVARMARQFICGRNAIEAVPVLRDLHRQGIAFSVDLLGEATLSEAECDEYQARYLDLIEHLPEEVARWPEDPVIDRGFLGPLPRANVSLKLSALDSQLDAVDPAGCVSRLKKRALPLFLRAREKNVFMHVDMEQWELHEIFYDLFEEIVTRPELRDWPHVGIVVQAYLKSSHSDVERLLSIARSRGAPITVRLVKGAYWDHEIVRARQHGYPCPVFTEKAATDANYEELGLFLLQHFADIQPAFGSHNLRSLCHALVAADRLRVPANAYEIQMLYGMAEPERKVFRASDRRVRVYSPVGELLPGIAYLVRRLLENTSNTSFLRLSYHEQVDVPTLMARPTPTRSQELPSRMKRGDLGTPFENCPLSDFTDPGVREAFARAVEETETTLPLRTPVVVGGKIRSSGRTLDHPCPSDRERVATTVVLATPEEAETAVEVAVRAWPVWRDRPVEERAKLLEVLADRLESDRIRLAAIETFEEAKPWREADADVAEAIDYCRYYARQALRELAPSREASVSGEDNVLLYEGRGPATIVAPWNFPIAILCGMGTAALVAGNTVLLKPAGQSSGVAYALYEHMLAVGFPPEVVQFLPGIGEEIGRVLVEHPAVALIAFTGSRKVGLSLIEKAAYTRPNQPQVKHVVCEMGAKNAIIVDEDADLDEALSGVMQSAFGYAGQKCSACSRLIVVGHAYEPLVKRLIEACRSLILAPAHMPGCRLGPVIDRDAHERLHGILSNPGEGATRICIGDAEGPSLSQGFFVPPAVFAVQDPNHILMQDELFGPILAIMAVKSFDEALDTALTTWSALTGSVYSRTPSHLEGARRRFRVGNLYLNRGCTGARVHRQPFGGFRQSGLGTKAGGPGYLLQFAIPRSITENTVRHGFVPDIRSDG